MILPAKILRIIFRLEDGEDILRELMMQASGILESHPINRERIKKGNKPANSIWFWGQGKKLNIPTFREKYALEGALVSAVDLMRGLGINAGFEILQVPGITGYSGYKLCRQGRSRDEGPRKGRYRLYTCRGAG